FSKLGIAPTALNVSASSPPNKVTLFCVLNWNGGLVLSELRKSLPAPPRRIVERGGLPLRFGEVRYPAIEMRSSPHPPFSSRLSNCDDWINSDADPFPLTNPSCTRMTSRSFDPRTIN